MIDMAMVSYVDIHQYYFDIDNFNVEKFLNVFEDEKDLKVSMNKVISKPKAITKACQIFQEEKNEFTELYVSTDAMKVNQIKDYFGEKIFNHLPEDVSGWLFFFDPIPFANWEHPCQYLFVVNDDCIEKVNYNRGVADTVRLEKVYQGYDENEKACNTTVWRN